MPRKCKLKECKVCPHASANVNHLTKMGWCCKHGVYIDDPSKKKMPAITTRVKNFTGSAIDHVKSGFKTRSETDQAKCMTICEQCEWVVKKRTGLWCPKCGCCGNLKSSWSTAHCPAGKW